MTTISSSSSTVKTLMALYEHENGSSGGSTKLTKDQVTSIETMLEGGSAAESSSATGTNALTGATTGSSTLTSIIDAIEAKSSGTTSTSTSSATTPQQKAASVMQGIYESQQANLFTLIG